jgi:hypothetical protein
MSLDAASKAVFVAAAERRKQRGIELKRIGMMAEKGQVEVFNYLFDGWVQRFGKEDAVDFLIAGMCEAEARLREWDVARRNHQKTKRLRRPK